MNVTPTFNGWAYDPVDEVWFAKTGPNTWTTIKGDLNHTPPISSSVVGTLDYDPGVPECPDPTVHVRSRHPDPGGPCPACGQL